MHARRAIAIAAGEQNEGPTLLFSLPYD